jgi:hypothetical protein
MTGPDHYHEAEIQAELAAHLVDEGRSDEARLALGLAQVYATLALAAATGTGSPGKDERGPGYEPPPVRRRGSAPRRGAAAHGAGRARRGRRAPRRPREQPVRSLRGRVRRPVLRPHRRPDQGRSVRDGGPPASGRGGRLAERWLPFPDWPYEVSDLGRVRSVDRQLRDGRTADGVELKPWREARATCA